MAGCLFFSESFTLSIPGVQCLLVWGRVESWRMVASSLLISSKSSFLPFSSHTSLLLASGKCEFMKGQSSNITSCRKCFCFVLFFLIRSCNSDYSCFRVGWFFTCYIDPVALRNCCLLCCDGFSKRLMSALVRKMSDYSTGSNKRLKIEIAGTSGSILTVRCQCRLSQKDNLTVAFSTDSRQC